MEQLGVLFQQVQQQAMTISYIEVFHTLMVFVLVITPLTIFLKQGKNAEQTG